MYCDERHTTTQQTLPDATGQADTTITAAEEPATPENVTEATAYRGETTDKVIHIIDGDTVDILTADKSTIRIKLTEGH